MALSYFDQLGEAFALARSQASEVEHSIEIGGTIVRLRFAGAALTPALLPALSPLVASADRAPDVEVGLWDHASTGVGVPALPWKLRDVIARGDVRSLSGGRIRAQVDAASQVLTLWDSVQRHALMWVRDARQLPDWHTAHPLRSILHWGLAGERRHLLHAAAIGDEERGALLVGPGGSGKSTTSLACLDGGLGFVADDYVLLELEPHPKALGLYATATLTQQGRDLLPSLAGRAPVLETGKLVFNVAELRPDAFRRCATISAIILPRVAGGKVAIRRVARVDALRALAPTTILQHAEESAGGMAVMSALVRQVPSYELELGPDLAAVAPAVRSLLDSPA